MKIILTSITLLSLSVFACPDLTGTYECVPPEGDVQSMTITQNGINFTFTSSDGAVEEIVADNQPITFSEIIEEGITMEGSEVYYCQGDSLYADANAIIKIEGVDEDYSMTVSAVATKTATGLEMKTSIDLMGSGFTDEITTCTKI